MEALRAVADRLTATGSTLVAVDLGKDGTQTLSLPAEGGQVVLQLLDACGQVLTLSAVSGSSPHMLGQAQLGAPTG